MAYENRRLNAAFKRALNNPFLVLMPISLRSIVILSSHLHLGLPNGYFVNVSLFKFSQLSRRTRTCKFNTLMRILVTEIWMLKIMRIEMIHQNDKGLWCGLWKWGFEITNWSIHVICNGEGIIKYEYITFVLYWICSYMWHECGLIGWVNSCYT